MTQIKLFTIVRSDLTSGQQLVQTAHAIADFSFEYYDEYSSWHKESNYIISLNFTL